MTEKRLKPEGQSGGLAQLKKFTTIFDYFPCPTNPILPKGDFLLFRTSPTPVFKPLQTHASIHCNYQLSVSDSRFIWGREEASKAMGFTSGQGVVTLLVLTASLLAVGMANRPIAGKPANHWNSGFNHSSWGPRNNPFHPNNTRPPKKFIVGGSERWRYGFNYTDWALKNGPFYINDTLGELYIYIIKNTSIFYT